MLNLLSTSVVSSVGYAYYVKLLAQYNRPTWVIVIGSSCESDATLKGIINQYERTKGWNNLKQ